MIQPNVAEVFQSAMALPDSVRAELAERLWESLPDESREEAADAWAVELSRRLHEYQSGEAEILSGPEVLRKLRSRYGKQS
ncbi:MAG: addiction module protein [Rhodopirellula sp.]|nr:addiction module protein [Rhodopirellula sp.]